MIETERLLLRQPKLEDLDRWAELMASEDAARYIGGVQPKSVVWRSMMSIAGSWQLTGAGMFSVVDKASGLWIGRVGPWQPYGWPGTEVGWSLHPDAWGRGYALEAARATMDYAVDTLGWTDIIHSIHPDNAPSQRLAERLGSVNRGPGRLPPPYESDHVDIWGQTSDEWRHNRTNLTTISR
ncbi:MAG: GNAT family N-acetyltransferase [Gemmatimonadaceae bacterium]